MIVQIMTIIVEQVRVLLVQFTKYSMPEKSPQEKWSPSQPLLGSSLSASPLLLVGGGVFGGGGRKALRDDPNNGCEGDYKKRHILNRQIFRRLR